MENLTIKHKTHVILRRFLGVIAIICGIIYFIISIGSPKTLNIILSVFWTLFGIAYLIPAIGPSESSVKIGEDHIVIKWLNWLRSKTVQDSAIEKITLTKFSVLIDRKNDKQVKLPVDFFELDQKREVYAYFMELSKQRNYPLEKIGFGT
jgi:hypothetical protein